MALLKIVHYATKFYITRCEIKEFTRAQHRSHTRRVCECQLFLHWVLYDGISCLDQRSSFTLSSTASKILLSQFSRNRRNRMKPLFNAIINCYIICEGILLPNTWTSQQYKNLKHGGRQPVASRKMTLRQVVRTFTGEVVSSKILRIFRWKLWVTLCSVPLSKWP